MKQKFNIEGMHCAVCSMHVERAVQAIEDVSSCNVNLLQNNMLVEFESEKTTQEIIDAVQKIGFSASIVEKQAQAVKKDYTKHKIILSFILLCILMYFSMGHMLSLPIPSFLEGHQGMIINATIQIIFTSIILYIHHHYFKSGFKALFRKQANMDSLVAIGSSSAYVYSLYLYVKLFSHPAQAMEAFHNLYFESAAMIVSIVALGKYLEERSKKKTGEALEKLMQLAPNSAIVIRQGKELEIEYEDIIVGDLLLIKPGEVIGVDGVVEEGYCFIDESSISGESLPIDKQVGDTLMSGTFNTHTTFTMKATKVKEDTTLSQIIKLVESASASKPNIAKLADKISFVFVPIILCLSFITLCVWLALGHPFSFAMQSALSVLVISCPCALGLATPTAIMVASGRAAKQGILMKQSRVFEKMHEIDYVLLDKTGTITQGSLQVSAIYSDNKQYALQIAASLESKSEHPISKAILKSNTQPLLNVKNFSILQGHGACGEIDENIYFIGNAKYMNKHQIDMLHYEKESERYFSQGSSVIYLATEKSVFAFFVLQDKIKPSSKKAISAIQDLGIKVAMGSGDHAASANHIAKDLHLHAIYSELLPKDKAQIIRELQASGHKVMMVGDGINDSVALSVADVSVAIGAGSDIAIECADVILIKNDLQDLHELFLLSHKVITNIKQNLFWAFFYNIIFIPVAAGMLYHSFHIEMNPMFAAIAMSLSSLCVVANALRLSK